MNTNLNNFYIYNYNNNNNLNSSCNTDLTKIPLKNNTQTTKDLDKAKNKTHIDQNKESINITNKHIGCILILVMLYCNKER